VDDGRGKSKLTDMKRISAVAVAPYPFPSVKGLIKITDL